jgi:hypothetical protein
VLATSIFRVAEEESCLIFCSPWIGETPYYKKFKLQKFTFSERYYCGLKSSGILDRDDW